MLCRAIGVSKVTGRVAKGGTDLFIGVHTGEAARVTGLATLGGNLLNLFLGSDGDLCSAYILLREVGRWDAPIGEVSWVIVVSHGDDVEPSMNFVWLLGFEISRKSSEKISVKVRTERLLIYPKFELHDGVYRVSPGRQIASWTFR